MASPDPAPDPAMLAGMAGLIAVMKDRRPAPASEVPSLGDASEDVGASLGRASALDRGAVVGRYVVIKKLGAGAMGVVYAAYDPELDRKVALKLLLPGLGGDERRERLRREAQALGKVAHPNIVAVHDVGTLGEQVWLAMEFVQGRTLGAWLAQQPRGWREVVKAMRSAGRGLMAAHAAGLLHRDFKPENVMVGDDGRVRVMDFGLARVGAEGVPSEVDPLPSQAAGVPPAMQLTAKGATIGTPAYMAPEQFDHAELTAAADQFAFSVSLWEALYGERPFRGRTYAELEANVLAGRRSPPPKERAVPKRLRLACERGLAVDPRQRWPAMEALVAELARLSAPRTRRWLALGVTGGLAALGGGLALARYVEVMDRCTGAQAQLEGIWDDAKRQAVKTAILGTEQVYAPATWERVEPRLDDYADAWTRKHTEVCEATRVTAAQTEVVMELRMGCLREHRTDLHAAVKVLAAADAKAVEKAVELVAGLPLLTRCDDVERLEQQRQRVPPPEDPQVGQEVEALREQLAEILAEERAGKYAQALAQVEPLVQQAEALGYSPLWAEARLRRGDLLDAAGKHAEAEQELQAAHALALAHDHDEVALDSARILTHVVGDHLARYAEGLVWGQMALPMAERRGEGIETAASLSSLGSVRERQGEYEQAELQFRRALGIREQVLGSEHPAVALSANNLGTALYRQGEHEQAELQFRRALQIFETVLGTEHPNVAMSATNLGNVLNRKGEYEQAELQFRRALRIREEALGPDHPDVALSANNLANALNRQGKHAQAEPHYRRALQIREEALGVDHPDVASTLNNLGTMFHAQGNFEQAKLHQQRALGIWEKTLGADHPNVAASLNNLGGVFHSLGELEPAVLHYRRALQLMEKRLGADHSDVAYGWDNLGLVLFEQGKLEEADLHHQRALQIREKALGADHPNVAESLVGLANVALAQHRHELARARAERAVSIHLASAVPPVDLARARFVLARVLWADETQRTRAQELAEQARDALAAHGKGSEYDLTTAQAWLAEHRVK